MHLKLLILSVALSFHLHAQGRHIVVARQDATTPQPSLILSTTFISSTPPMSTTRSTVSFSVPGPFITSTITSVKPSLTTTISPQSTSLNSTVAIAEPVLPLNPKITPGLAFAGAVLLLSGILYTVIGIKNAWLYIFASASYLAGLAVTVLIIYLMTPPISNAVQGAFFVAAAATGLIVGGLALIFRDLADGLGCLLGGFCLSMWFLTTRSGGLIHSTAGRAIFIGCLSLACFALSFSHYTRKYGLVVCISFGGATITVLGIDCFSKAGLKEFWMYLWSLNPAAFPPTTKTYPINRGMKVELAAIVLLCVAGIISQLQLWNVVGRRRRQSREEELDRERGLELGRKYREHSADRKLLVFGTQSEVTIGSKSAPESTFVESEVTIPTKMSFVDEQVPLPRELKDVSNEDADAKIHDKRRCLQNNSDGKETSTLAPLKNPSSTKDLQSLSMPLASRSSAPEAKGPEMSIPPPIRGSISKRTSKAMAEMTVPASSSTEPSSTWVAEKAPMHESEPERIVYTLPSHTEEKEGLMLTISHKSVGNSEATKEPAQTVIETTILPDTAESKEEETATSAPKMTSNNKALVSADALRSMEATLDVTAAPHSSGLPSSIPTVVIIENGGKSSLLQEAYKSEQDLQPSSVRLSHSEKRQRIHEWTQELEDAEKPNVHDIEVLSSSLPAGRRISAKEVQPLPLPIPNRQSRRQSKGDSIPRQDSDSSMQGRASKNTVARPTTLGRMRSTERAGMMSPSTSQQHAENNHGSSRGLAVLRHAQQSPASTPTPETIVLRAKNNHTLRKVSPQALRRLPDEVEAGLDGAKGPSPLERPESALVSAPRRNSGQTKGLGLLQVQDFDSHAPKRTNASGSSEKRESMLAGWRESIRQGGSLHQLGSISEEARRMALMEEKRQTELARQQQMAALQQQDLEREDLMRSGDMMDAHRKAMRRLQSSGQAHSREHID